MRFKVAKVIEAAKAIEATKAASATEFAKVVESAKVAEVANATESVEESIHLNKEAEREFVEVSAHRNPCKSSNVETTTNYDYVNVNTSSILFRNTTIPNQPFGTITKPTN